MVRFENSKLKPVSNPSNNLKLPAQSLFWGVSHALDLEVARGGIASSREVLMDCLVKIADMSQPVRRGLAQFSPKEARDTSWQDWHEHLLLCCEILADNRKQELQLMNAEQLEAATAELEGIADDAVGIVRSLRVAVFGLQEAYENNREEVEQILGTRDISEEISPEQEEVYGSHYEYDAADKDQRQLRDWIDNLDEIENKLGLALATPHIPTIADLITRMSSDEIAISKRPLSAGIGLYRDEAISAIQAVLSPMVEAWREITALPPMTAEQVAVAFQSEGAVGPGEKDYWQHIHRMLTPNAEGLSAAPVAMPIELAEQAGRKVLLTLSAPDTTLTHCRGTWEKLAQQMESVKPLLTHLKAELAVLPKCPGDTMKFVCELTLPGECKYALAPSDSAARVMQRDEVILRGQSPGQSDRIGPLVISDDHGESNIRLFTSASALCDPMNRKPLGIILPRLARVAARLGVKEVYAIPTRAVDENESWQQGESFSADESHDYLIELIARSQPLSNEGATALLAGFQQSLTYLRRWVTVGDDVQQIETESPRLDRRIKLRGSYLQQPAAIEALMSLNKLSSIEALDLYDLPSELCGPAIDLATHILRQVHGDLKIDQQTRVVLMNPSDPKELYMVISDDDGGLWASVEFTLEGQDYLMREFPHQELAQLSRILPECIEEVVRATKTLEVTKLQRQLHQRGFPLCDDLVNHICQEQIGRGDSLLSADYVTPLLLAYFVFSRTGRKMEVAKGVAPKEVLRVTDPKQRVFSQLVSRPPDSRYQGDND